MTDQPTERPEPDQRMSSAGGLSSAPRARWMLLRHSWHLAWWSLLAVPIVLLGLVFTLAHTATGTAWLLASLDRLGSIVQSWGVRTVPMIRVDGPRGALLAPDFAVERVEVRWDAGRQAVIVEGARLTDAQWRWFPARGIWAGVHAQRVEARKVVIQTGPSHLRDVAAVRSLEIPLSVETPDVRADAVVIDRIAPFENVRGRAAMNTQADQTWRFTDVKTRWHEAALQGELTMGTVDALRFEGRVKAEVPPRQIPSRQGTVKVPAWQGDLIIGGRIDQMNLRAQVEVKGSPVHLRLEAQLHPFKGWPLSTTRLDMSDIDLAMLQPNWPRTRLTGHADLTLEQPVSVEQASRWLAQVQIDNDLAGSWEQGRIPLRRVRARVEEASPLAPDLVIRDLALELTGHTPRTKGTGADALSSRLAGEGTWSPAQGLNLRTQWQHVLLTDLWRQAPALRLSGQLDLQARSSDPAVQRAAPGAESWSMSVKGTLNGPWANSAAGPSGRAPVGIDLDMAVDPRRWHIERFALRSGGTALQGQVDVSAWQTDQWQVQTQGRLQSFDPRPWLSPEVMQTLATGQTALSGDWALTARLPRPSPSNVLDLGRSRALSGQGQFHLQDSVFMGQALEARLELTQSGLGETLKTQAKGEGQLGPNRLRWEGQLDAFGDGSRDQWQAWLDAPDLGAWRTLTPLMGLSSELLAVSQQWPYQGRASAQLDVQGRWPRIQSRGETRVQQSRGSRWEARDLQLQWQVDTDDRSVTQVKGRAEALRWDTLRLSNARVEGSGTSREHRLQVVSDWPYAPSETAMAFWGLDHLPEANTRVQFELKGGLTQGLQTTAPQWQGTLDKVWVGSPGKPATPTNAWLSADSTRLNLQWDSQGRLSRVTTSAGTARMSGGLVGEWDEWRWTAGMGTNPPNWSAQARIRPFELAPWLQRATPGLAWSGDLKAGASIRIQAHERLSATVEVGRRSGKLAVNDGDTTLDLGVSDLQLSARVQDGLWTVTPLFVGKTLGVITGAVTLQTDPTQRWPDPRSALEGALHASVPNLAIWRAWLPPGWRLSGELWSTVQLQGQWNEPEVRGELEADRLALRNPLQGVDVKDGRLRLQLQGSQAQMTELFIRGGDGDLHGTGVASLGSRPQAQVNVQARQFRVLGRVDRQLTASGQAKLNWSAAQLGIDGLVQIDNGLFDLTAADAPALDRDVVVLRPAADAARASTGMGSRATQGLAASATQAAQAAISLARPPAIPTQMKLSVRLGDKLRLKGRGMDTRLGGDILLSSPQSRLNVNGSVQTLGGSYAAYGQKLTIERGLIQFSGPVENPALDILALRPNLDTRVGVAITGTALTPRIRLYSDPDLPESDKLSWLVLGRGSSGLGRADSTVLQRAALALLAGEGEAPTDALLKTLGIDDLSLRQGEGDVKDTVVSLGKQISRNWYLGYERSVNAAGGTFQLIYRLGQNFTLRAQSGVENAVDLIWTWRFNGPGSLREGTP